MDGGFDLAQGPAYEKARRTRRPSRSGRQRWTVPGRTAPPARSDTSPFMGGQVSPRWIYTHMIAEYARHRGHADLIRERIDDRAGV
jgi:hypothetical protein